MNRNQDKEEKDDQSEGEDSKDEPGRYWPSLFDTALSKSGT